MAQIQDQTPWETQDSKVAPASRAKRKIEAEKPQRAGVYAHDPGQREILLESEPPI